VKQESRMGSMPAALYSIRVASFYLQRGKKSENSSLLVIDRKCLSNFGQNRNIRPYLSAEALPETEAMARQTFTCSGQIEGGSSPKGSLIFWGER
jgi:hypothetical protein